MSIDKFLDRVFVPRKYTCWEFTREVWLDLTGEDLGINPFNRYCEKVEELEIIRGNANRLLITPKSPCFVLMLSDKDPVPHTGVFIDGKILHLPRNSNVHFERIENILIGFNEVRFYK